MVQRNYSTVGNFGYQQSVAWECLQLTWVESLQLSDVVIDVVIKDHISVANWIQFTWVDNKILIQCLHVGVNKILLK